MEKKLNQFLSVSLKVSELLFGFRIQFLEESGIELDQGALTISDGKVLSSEDLLLVPDFKHALGLVHQFLSKTHGNSLEMLVAPVLENSF